MFRIYSTKVLVFMGLIGITSSGWCGVHQPGDFVRYDFYTWAKTNSETETNNHDIEKITYVKTVRRGLPPKEYWLIRFDYKLGASRVSSRTPVDQDTHEREGLYQDCISNGGEIEYINLPRLQNVKTCFKSTSVHWRNPSDSQEWRKSDLREWIFENPAEHNEFAVAKMELDESFVYRKNNYKEYQFKSARLFMDSGHQR